MKTVAAIGIVLLLACQVQGQEPPRTQEGGLPSTDSLSHRNAASVLFERNLNTFNWAGNIVVDTMSIGHHIRLNELYTSNIILIPGTPSSAEQRLQSNQQRLSLSVTRPWNEEIGGRAEWSSLIYSDNKAVGLSTASYNMVLGGIEYAPDPILTITPMVGHRWDNQLDVRDRGLSYSLAARTNDIDLDGYRVAGKAQFQQDRLNPRFLEQDFIRLGTQKTFLGKTRDSLEFGFNRNRREFYILQNGGLESRRENIFSFSNLIDYELVPSFVTSLFVNVYSLALEKDYRAVDNANSAPYSALPQNTGVDEFHIDAFVQAVYQSDDNGALASARLSYTEREERHFLTGDIANFRDQQAQEQSKDNLTHRTAFSGLLSLPVSHSDAVRLSGSISILRYDTPSKDNDDDRDEQLAAVSLSTSHNLSQYLELSFALEGTLSHIVYLLSDRSANNNINRVLRLSPRTLYKPVSRFTTMNQVEVLANYTVYDFETDASQVKSFSYRQFGWIDSTSLDITSTVGLDLYAYLKLYDRGQLNWSQFTERRENSFVDKTYALQVRYAPTPGTMFAIGVRYFSQSRYSYAGELRTLDSFLRSFGPTCMVSWQLSRFSNIGIKGWYENRRLEGGGTSSMANMTMNVNVVL